MKDPAATLAAVPVATILILVIAVAGAVVVCVHPEALNFASYVKYVGVAAGLLSVGRGLDSVHRP